jgi:hypothetical protein
MWKKVIISLVVLMIGTVSSMTYGQDIYNGEYQWRIPGGQYIDPVSFFSIHGYVNGVYASYSEQWKEGNMNGIGKPGHVIVPNTNNASFNNDEAIWISSELGEKLFVMMELHLVNDPSGNGAAGPGGLTFVLTEANLRYELIKNYLAASIGTFWSVFGIQNQDWLGAQNLFSMIPMASGAYLTHFNEKGIRLDGHFDRGAWGFNYVMSLGNGFNAYDISGYNSFDLNSNSTFNARVSVFPGLKKDLNIGLSYGSGLLFKQDVTASTDSMEYYDNYFEAFGIDTNWQFKDIKLRSYLISSTQKLSNLDESRNLNALGWMGEMSYRIDLQGQLGIDAILPKIRFDVLDNEEFDPQFSDKYQTIGVGLNFQIQKNFILSFDYNWIEEEQIKLNNDRFIFRASANF